MTTNKKPLIVLTAGGTGGHVYPADSLANELYKRGYRLALITDARGKNNYKGKLGEIPNYAVLAGALVGKSKLFKLKSLIKTTLGIIQALFFLLILRPKYVVGFGGYASFPCCCAAIILRKKLIIHEQNSVMSRTNRLLSKHAALIAKSFAHTKFMPANIKSVLTGMPIRQSIIEVRGAPYPKTAKPFQILILGGSQGAKILSDVMPEVIKSFNKKEQKNFKIFQQCRKDDVPATQKAYQDCAADITVSAFYENMPELYQNSNLIVSRSGASSVYEILAVGRPSILVPFPAAADDHQTYNAKEVGDADAGIVIKQEDFTIENISRLIKELVDSPAKLAKLAANAKKAGITDAAARFADAIERE